MTLRTKETQKKYDDLKAAGRLEGSCKFCEAEPIKSFEHWNLFENDFPYDKVAEVHHVVAPKRHVTEEELSDDEKAEWKKLKQGYINDNYTFIFESTERTMTIPAHYHLQLMVDK